MADRYGDDMEFNKRWEASMKKLGNPHTSHEANDNSDSNLHVSCIKNGDVKVSSHSKEVKGKEIDKSSWEYWEQHAPNKDIVWDGRNYIPNKMKSKKEAKDIRYHQQV